MVKSRAMCVHGYMLWDTEITAYVATTRMMNHVLTCLDMMHQAFIDSGHLSTLVGEGLLGVAG